MTTAQIAYGTAQTPAKTQIAALASDTTGLVGAGCASIDNSSLKAVDYQCSFTFTLGAAPTAAKQFSIYMYSKVDGTNFTGAANGTDSTQTFIAEQLATLQFLVSKQTANTASGKYTVTFSLLALAGLIPTTFGFWVNQSSGQAFTACTLSCTPITYTNT